jgi:hypothetical protein
VPKQIQLAGEVAVQRGPDGGLVVAIAVSPFEQYVIQWDAAAGREHVKACDAALKGAKRLLVPDASLAVVGGAV